MDMNVKKHLEILGYKVEDVVTGIKGVASTVAFDLYGCIQVAINPGLDKDGKHAEIHWYDISRVRVKSSKRVMEPPDFDFGPVAEGFKGAAEKPSFFKP